MTRDAPVRRLNARRLVACLCLAAGLIGCGSAIRTAAYPADWPARVAAAAAAACPDISGRYQGSDGEQALAFFLFGVADRASPDWAELVRVNERLLADPGDSVVTIGAPDPDHIDVVVAVRGMPIARQVLTRSRRSASSAEMWSGQPEKSFRCEPGAIVVAGAFVHDWEQYRLPDAEKRRRYPRPGGTEVGISRGYFDFAKAADGSLVMRQRLYHCYGSCSLDERWRRWPAVRSAASSLSSATLR